MRRSRSGSCSRAVPANTPRSPPTVKFGPLPAIRTARTLAFSAIWVAASEIGGHVRIDRVALLRTVEAQGRDAIGEIEQHGPQRAAGLTPARRVGVLLKRANAPLVDRQQMRKVRIEGRAALPAPAAIAARHQQAAIGQITVVMTTNAKWHSLGRASGEFRVE
jgi:hypothetical protein